jgi:predicted RNase H-like HicB family nuclease
MKLRTTYKCKVLLCPELSGGYSIHALTLPGVVSQGDTESEAIANIKEAFEGALASYLESGDPIPWTTEEYPPEATTGSQERWVEVDA